VFAQSADQFVSAFSGKWQIYEPSLGKAGATCKLDLTGLAASGSGRPLETADCAAPLDTAKTWTIDGNQLVFFDTQNQPIVRLGGNQRRVTGTLDSGTPIILERAGGDGTAALLQTAYAASGCYYVGYTQKCAERTELGLPVAGPDGRISIGLEVNLNAHSEPRADADTIGTVQQGTCVVVDTCTMASDGPWCRARFGDTVGWLHKFSMRQNRWPVMTYSNACSP
jgi:hypothetical protein